MATTENQSGPTPLNPLEVNTVALDLLGDLDGALRDNRSFQESSAAFLSQNLMRGALRTPGLIPILHRDRRVNFTGDPSDNKRRVGATLSLKDSYRKVTLVGFENPTEEDLRQALIQATDFEPNTQEAADFAKGVINFLKTPAADTKI